MKIAAAAASRGSTDKLLGKIIPAVKEPLAGRPADLGVLFATNHFEDDMEAITGRIRDELRVKNLIGCTAEGVIGPSQEYEQETAMSLWVADLPGCEITPFVTGQADLEAKESDDQVRRWLNVTGSDKPTIIALGDPFSVDANGLLGVFNKHLPGCPVIGGMASGAEGPAQSVLVFNDEVLREGVVGVALTGGPNVTAVVSQGCRPIGRPFVITKAERNIIHTLGGQKPLAVLNEIYSEAAEEEQKLMQQGVFVGRVINEQKDKFQRGDFLIRNLMGADEETGAIAVGDLVRAGTTVQFQVRDAATADEDLRSLLSSQSDVRPAGALLFSCNGRGSRMFSEPHHDVTVLRENVGDIPVAGFFCAGELGPIGGKNFIHGHTASIALFRPS